ncbi:MAG: DUF47 family protein [Thaumarchaeota archaeon]|nr:DUF47 family protein [Nitrososphaerota archaeon]
MGEPEIQAKRKILSVLMEESRKSVDAVRQLSQMMFDEAGRDESRAKIEQMRLDIKGSRRALTRGLAEMGSMIMNKEDIMRAAYEIEELVDLIDGTAFRVRQVDVKAVKKAGIDADITQLLDKLVEILIKMNEMVRVLQMNSDKASELLPAVETAENEIDQIYRQLLLNVFGEVSDIKFLILIKDILERLDRIADLSLSIADNIVIVSIGL